MNNRIQELIPRPWTFPYPDREMYSREQMEQLAESIVRECAEQCDLLLDSKMSSEWTRGTHDCSKAIKKHFGVEE